MSTDFLFTDRLRPDAEWNGEIVVGRAVLGGRRFAREFDETSKWRKGQRCDYPWSRRNTGPH